jgi:hypothetical protein
MTMPHDPDVPVNPLPNPNLGDVNQPSPVSRSQEASWRPYDGSTGQPEAEGELDEEGRRRAPETHPDRTADHGRDLPDDCGCD